MILASAYVIVSACVTDPRRHGATEAVAPVAAHSGAQEEWCGEEEVLDRDALHAVIEARIAEHSAAFAACAPADTRERTVVTVHIMLNVCGQGSLGTESPHETLDATKLCIDRVLSRIPFPSFGDRKFWHKHEFVFGEAQP